jgi:hypothetical protein
VLAGVWTVWFGGGDGALVWIPACAGMTVGVCGNDGWGDDGWCVGGIRWRYCIDSRLRGNDVGARE